MHSLARQVRHHEQATLRRRHPLGEDDDLLDSGATERVGILLQHPHLVLQQLVRSEDVPARCAGEAVILPSASIDLGVGWMGACVQLCRMAIVV